MTVLLAIGTGLGLGYIIERGDLCFHSTWRDLMRRPRRTDLFYAYLLLLLISIPLVQIMIRLGLIEPWIPPFVWQANVVGGLIFGIGMVIAATCITGVFYKLGHGMAGMLLAMAAWAAGDIVTYVGPLSPLREALRANPVTVAGASPTVGNTFGPMGTVALLLLAVATAVILWRAPRRERGKLWRWPLLGVSMGLFLSLAWLLARAGGSDYTFGTSGVPTGLFLFLTGQAEGGSSPWIPLTLAALIPGAFIASRRAGTFWLRGEATPRYLQLALGGFIMGIGAGLAGGCNLGHGMVGVSLLSLGSITSTLSIIIGVFLADRALKLWRRRQPALVNSTT